MKRLFSTILVLILILGLSACSGAVPEESSSLPVETKTTEALTEAASTENNTEPITEATEGSTAELPPIQTLPDPEQQRTALGDYAGPVYRIKWPDREYNICLDRYGNLLTYEQRPWEVKDVLTGEVRFYCCAHYETGERGLLDVIGSVLYDLEGNLVLEEAPYLYEQCMGDMVAYRRAETENEPENANELEEPAYGFRDLKTGETKLAGVYYLKKLDGSRAIALDENFDLLGVLDVEGNVLGGFPMEEKYHNPEPVAGYMTAGLYKPGYSSTVVLNAKPRCILHADGSEEQFHLYDCGSRGLYCGLSDWKAHPITTLYRANPWEKLYQLDMGIVAMDGHRMICVGEQDPDGQYLQYLCDMDGNILAGPFREYLRVLERDQEGLMTLLLAMGKDKLLLLDGDGNVLKEREIPDLDYVYLVPWETEYQGGERTGITVNTWRQDDTTGEVISRNFILAPDLEDFTPAGYSYATRAWVNVWWGYPEDSNATKEEGRITLFTSDGTVLMTGLLSVGAGGPDGIPVLAKDRVGLVDKYGRWIAWTDWDGSTMIWN